MLILGDVGLQIRLSKGTIGKAETVNMKWYSLLGWICNPTVMSISIFYAEQCLGFSNSSYL